MLVGLHDFAAFCRFREGGTTVRELAELSWARDGRGPAPLLVATVVADAFCHSMVRALVGALIPWLGFAVPMLLSGVAWEQRSWKLFGINAGYQLAALLTAAMILAHWRE